MIDGILDRRGAENKFSGQISWQEILTFVEETMFIKEFMREKCFGGRISFAS